MPAIALATISFAISFAWYWDLSSLHSVLAHAVFLLITSLISLPFKVALCTWQGNMAQKHHQQ